MNTWATKQCKKNVENRLNVSSEIWWSWNCSPSWKGGDDISIRQIPIVWFFLFKQLFCRQFKKQLEEVEILLLKISWCSFFRGAWLITFGFVVGVCARGQCSYGSEADLRILLLGAWIVHNASSQEQRGFWAIWQTCRGELINNSQHTQKYPEFKIRE